MSNKIDFLKNTIQKYLPFKNQYRTIYMTLRHPHCPLIHKILFVFTIIYILLPYPILDILPGPLDDTIISFLVYYSFKFEHDILYQKTKIPK